MLTKCLADPTCFLTLTKKQQSLVIAEARYFNMLAQLKPAFEKTGLWEQLPSSIKQHIHAAHAIFVHQQDQLYFEKRQFQKIFTALNIEWVYLKGSAYHFAGFSEFSGRLMSDIDILVSEAVLANVEKALKEQGWLSTHLNDYDQKFYRQWSQEIPPMRHLKRRTELDLHFNILPNTLKESPNPSLLRSQAVDIDDNENTGKILSPAAMVIHSAIHLFYESEYSKGVRDLYDLYLLLTRFTNQPEFWNQLMELQTQIGNGDSMYYALRYCQQAFDLVVPQHVEVFYQQYKPSHLKLTVADFAFKRALFHSFPTNRLPGHQAAIWILYIRGHLKRMPVKLLIPHLLRKALVALTVKEKNEDVWI